MCNSSGISFAANYNEAVLRLMIEKGCICTCIVAFNLENGIGDLKASKKFGMVLEKLVFCWFGMLGFRMLNVSFHSYGCTCTNCVRCLFYREIVLVGVVG